MQALISMGQEISTVSVVDDLLGRMTNKAKGICFATILAAFAFIVLVIWLYSAGSSTGYVEVSRAKRHMNVVDGNENETSASAYLTKEANLENNIRSSSGVKTWGRFRLHMTEYCQHLAVVVPEAAGKENAAPAT